MKRGSHGRLAAPRIAIIGCGFGGIAAAVKLTRAGLDFTIFEQASGIGGTWWDNRYPGAATDTPISLYSYSFQPYDWAGTHGTQAELQDYMEQVVDRFGFRRSIRLGTRVESLAWQDDRQLYLLTTGDGTENEFEVVISAVGMLNVPRYPNWPGREQFGGVQFHTARWEPEHDLSGKRVAVVGTGSTSAQVVPALAEQVGRLTIFQREPGWVLPKDEETFTPERRVAVHRPRSRVTRRLREFLQLERGLATGMFDPDRKVNQRLQAVARDHVTRVFAGRPDLERAMMPDYDFLCKRPVKSSTYYPAFLRENVELVPYAVTSVDGTGLIDSTGTHHPIDVLVMATGFEPVDYLSSLTVTGRGGRDLHEMWNGEPEAFLGASIPEFPNLFVLYGPNTNGGAIIFNLERQSEYAVRAIRRMMRHGIRALVVNGEKNRRYNDWVQRGMEGTSFVGSCHNYFRAATGKVVTQWPFTASLYWAMTRFLGRWALDPVPSRPVAEPVSRAADPVAERSRR